MRGAWFQNPWFFPLTIAVFVAGNAFDLLGTYVHQPNFEREANPIYLFLQPYGLRLNWPLVIVAKVLICLLCAVGLRFFLTRRRHYYPDHAAGFREFLTHFMYGRPLSWLETTYKLPWSLPPSILLILATWSFGGPFFAYLGYANLASKYGWWQLGGVWFGRYWLDWSVILWVFVAFALVCWQLWRDFQEMHPMPKAASAGAGS